MLAIEWFHCSPDFGKISFSIWFYLIAYFQKSFPKISTIYALKNRVLDFDCCPSVLNSIAVEWIFKGLLACIQRFVQSDNEIRVIRNIKDIVCWRCIMFGLWNVGDVGCWGCKVLAMWVFGDVGCWNCGMLKIWDFVDVGCLVCEMFGNWDVGDVEL